MMLPPKLSYSCNQSEGDTKQYEPAVAGEKLRKEPRFKRLMCPLTPEVHIRSNVNEITLETVIFFLTVIFLTQPKE